jgi:hypothetical protein
MALYASRIADMDTRAKALEAAKADYLAGRTTADATLQKAALAEATDRQKNAADFKKAGAERFGLSAGGTSVSSGGTGGGARGGGGAATGKVQEFETATRGQSAAEKLAALKEIGGPGGILADLSPAERATTQFEILDRQHARDAADLELSGLTAAEADIKAAADLVDELAKTDPAMARAYESRGTAAPAGTGGTPSASARVDRGQVSAPRYPGLGEMPAVEEIKTELSPSEAQEFDKSIAKIVEERKLLGLPPELPSSDYITLARRIAAGRIAGQVGGPAAPFEQQLRLDTLLNKSPEEREAIKAAFVASRAAPPAVLAAPIAEPAVPAAAADATAAVTAATAKPAPAPSPEAPMAPVVVPVTPPLPPLRFTGEFADPEAEAFMQEVGLPVSARTAALRAPSIAPRLGIENMLAQRPVSGGFSAKAAPIPDRMRLRAMSMQPEDYAVPAAEVRPQYVPPLDLDERGNVPPPAGMNAEEMRPMKLDTRRVAPMSPPPAEKPKPTASNYFQKRYEAANDLAQKPDKLNRLVASGAGKVVEAIYAANAKTNIPFERGWQEIALQYSNDVEKMKGAHEILLALDIASENKLKPKA